MVEKKEIEKPKKGKRKYYAEGEGVFVGWTGVIDSSAVTCGANEWPIWTRYTVIRGHAPGGARGPSGAVHQGVPGGGYRGGFAPAGKCFWIHETETHIWNSFARNFSWGEEQNPCPDFTWG